MIDMRLPKPTLILLCGLPGAGKTTLAKQLAEERSAIRFCPDEWLIELGIDPFNNEARDRLEKQLWKFSQELLRMGQGVILENGFWSRKERDDKRLWARAHNRAVELHYLDLPINVLWQRLDARNKQNSESIVRLSREQLEHWASKLEAPDSAELKLFDNFEEADA